jgi:hypothetical protein
MGMLKRNAMDTKFVYTFSKGYGSDRF